MKNFILGILFVVFGRRFLNNVLDLFLKIIESPRARPVVKDYLVEKVSSFLFDEVPPAKTHTITVSMKNMARVFGPDNENWTNQSEHNWAFLSGIQSSMNNVLKIKGHVLLNDVYEAVGFQRTQEGMLLGWTANDVIIIDREKWDDDDAMLLHFNPKGLIYAQLPTEEQAKAQV